MNRVSLLRPFLAAAALAAAVALSGCNTEGALPTSDKAMRPLSEKMVAEIESKGMDKDSPILIRLFKQESELEIWKQDRTGRFALLKTYPICRWSGELGPKIREGDRQAPEGFYTISPAQMNPNSQLYLSFDLGYPNAFDRAHGRTGMHLMVHGDCSSSGCYAMTDEQISEIYGLGREAFFGGQRAFQLQAYPFRMTPQNFARHRGNPNVPFWKMLRQGNDHFEATRLEPKVNVCDRRYVFDVQSPGDPAKPLAFNATAKCPVFEVPPDIVAKVKDKQRRDDVLVAELSRVTPVAPIRTNSDGGMHPVFAAVVKRNELGAAPSAFSLASAPGTVPATVRPPRTAEFAEHHLAAGIETPSTTNASGPVRIAPASPEIDLHSAQPQIEPPSRSGNLFSNPFFSGSWNSKPAAQGPDKGPVDRIAKLIGLRSSEPAPSPEAAPEAAPAAAMAPRARKAAAQNATPAAIRRMPLEVEPAGAAPPPAPATASAFAPPKPATAAIAGSSPTVPAGSFENRWSAFR